MFTKIQPRNKNRLLTRFHTSISEKSDHDNHTSNNLSHSYCTDLNPQSEALETNRYSQHIGYLQKKLITLNQDKEHLEERVVKLEKQNNKLNDQVKCTNKKKNQLNIELNKANQKIANFKQEKQIEKIHHQIKMIEQQYAQNNKKTLNKSHCINSKPVIQNSDRVLILQFMKNDKNWRKKCQQMINNKNSLLAIHNHVNLTILSVQKQKDKYEDVKVNQYDEKIKKLESAIYYLKKKLESETKKNKQNQQFMAQKQEIVKSFSRENRNLKENIQLLKQKIDHLEIQSLQIQAKYSQDLSDSDNRALKIQQDLQIIIQHLRKQYRQKQSQLQKSILCLEKQLNQTIEQNKQLNIEKDALKDEIKSRNILELENNNYKTELQRKNLQISELQNNIKEITNNLQQCEEQKNQKQKTNEKLLLENKKINQELKERAQCIKKLKRNHEEALSAVHTSMRQFQQKLVDSNSNLMKELATKNTIIQNLEIQLHETSNKNEEKQQMLNNMTIQMENIKKFLDKSKIDCETQSEPAERQFTIQELQAGLEQIVKEKDQNIFALRDENQEIRNSLEMIEQQNQQLLNESENNQMYLEAAKRKIEQLKEQLEKSDLQMQQKQYEINQLQKSINILEEKQIEYRQYIERIKN